MTLHKMVDGREDREANFQFIEEVQNCPDLWDVSSAAYKETKNKRVVVGFLLIYDFVQTFLFFQRLPFFFFGD